MKTDFLNTVHMSEAGEGNEGGGGAPAAAPAPAAAAEPAPAPAGNEPGNAPGNESGETENEAVEYEKTGNPTLDYVTEYIGNHGLGPDHPAVQAALEGSFEQLQVELMKRNAPGADQIMALAQREYESHTQEQERIQAETGQALIEIAGGGEQWEEVVSWARENADDAEKTVINDLLEAGGPSAKIAAQFLVGAHRNATGTEYEGESATSPAAAPAAAPSNTPLSRAEFAQEAEKLYRQLGNEYQASPQYQALARRRFQ